MNLKHLFLAGISLPIYRASLQYDYNPFIGYFELQIAINTKKLVQKREYPQSQTLEHLQSVLKFWMMFQANKFIFA